MPKCSIDGCEIYYELLGPEDPVEPPVALLNGVLMTVESWSYHSRRLSASRRCLLHDFRGQLASAKPPGPYSMERHADDFRRLLDHLGIERCHLVGTSYGGEVAMVFAAACPERVASLAAIASVARVDDETRRRVEAWAAATLEGPRDFYRAVARDSYSKDFLARNPRLLAQGEARLETFPKDFFPAFTELVRAFTAFDVTGSLGAIRCPTLVVAAALDRLKPVRFSREIAAAIPGAELLVVEDAGHAVVVEKAREVYDAVSRFLDRTQLRVNLRWATGRLHRRGRRLALGAGRRPGR